MKTYLALALLLLPGLVACEASTTPDLDPGVASNDAGADVPGNPSVTDGAVPDVPADASDAGREPEADAGDDAALGDGTAPTVVLASPADGERVVPNQIAGRTIAVTFSEPMDVIGSPASIVLDSDLDGRTLDVAWNETATAFTVAVGALVNAAQLVPNARYRIDLRGFRDQAGTLVDPSALPLREGALTFDVIALDGDHQHTCGHTDDAYFATLGLGTDAESSPDVSVPHKRYLLAYPAGQNEGWLHFNVPRIVPILPKLYRFYTDSRILVNVTRRSDGLQVAASSQPLPPMCVELTDRSTVNTSGEDTYDMFILGNAGDPTLEVILESDTPQ